MGAWASRQLSHAADLCLQDLLEPAFYIPLLLDGMPQLYMPSFIGLVSQTVYFMMGASGHMVTWWPMVRCSGLLRSSRKPKAVSQKESSYLHRIAWFYFKILRVFIVIH